MQPVMQRNQFQIYLPVAPFLGCNCVGHRPISLFLFLLDTYYEYFSKPYYFRVSQFNNAIREEFKRCTAQEYRKFKAKSAWGLQTPQAQVVATQPEQKKPQRDIYPARLFLILLAIVDPVTTESRSLPGTSGGILIN